MEDPDVYSAPPPPPPSAPTSSDRRLAFLIARLRSRQITMEEATELFGLQQNLIARLTARATLMPAGGPSRISTSAGEPRPPSTPSLPALSDDHLALGLVVLGAGAGLLAAILKRSGGPLPTASRS